LVQLVPRGLAEQKTNPSFSHLLFTQPLFHGNQKRVGHDSLAWDHIRPVRRALLNNGADGAATMDVAILTE